MSYESPLGIYSLRKKISEEEQYIRTSKKKMRRLRLLRRIFFFLPLRGYIETRELRIEAAENRIIFLRELIDMEHELGGARAERVEREAEYLNRKTVEIWDSVISYLKRLRRPS